MGEPKSKRPSFFSVFFGSKSKNEKLDESPHRLSRDFSDRDLPLRRRSKNGRSPSEETDVCRRRPRRPDAPDTKGKGRELWNGRPAHSSDPLTQWPPQGIDSDEELALGHAMQLICRGVPVFKGQKRPIPHASDHHYLLYAAVGGGTRGDRTDAANQHDAMTQLMTLRLSAPGPANRAWETLEQPSYRFHFGSRPGTITLNHWAAKSSVLLPPIVLRDPGMFLRSVTLEGVLERLHAIENSRGEEDEDTMCKNLYRYLLRNRDKSRASRRTLDKQITDLIMALSRPDWIDFSNPKNQIVTRRIFDTSDDNYDQYLHFFHQLLLSVELYMRIHAGHHAAKAKEKLLPQIPPTIQWNLALARRWRDHVRVLDFGDTPDDVHLRFKLKNRQARMLKRFAQMMKWPNLSETLASLREREAEARLDVSSHAMAFFSGLILPGTTFPFLIMNSLIDIDPDKATDDLALLSHLYPHCGFQYRSSYTYWTSSSVVGKVLAPTCLELAGWVGPARPTPDLGRSQIARIRARRANQSMSVDDVLTMPERSDPLGPPSNVYPVDEFELVAPSADDPVDTVRIELLSLRLCPDRADEPGPRWYEAGIQFAIDGISWPLRLNFDISFVDSWPCTDGPHPLFFDYAFEAVKVDELVDIRDWNGSWAHNSRTSTTSPSPHAARGSGGPSGGAAANHNYRNGTPDDEKVLVVEAFGVRDNEVLARAWCAHWGLSAVVADLDKTCMACAIREAYAAALTVVILVDDNDVPDAAE